MNSDIRQLVEEMVVTFKEIENAYEFVSWGEPLMHFAVLRLSTGEIFLRSEDSEEDDYPPDFEDNLDDFIDIPDQHELDLGRPLVFRFVDRYAPELRSKVMSYFSRRGAYSRFKDLLERRKLLEKWYDFEQLETQRALTEWCREHEIEVDCGQ